MILSNKKVFLILGVLTLIFLGRVLGQFLQFVNPVDTLPSFDRWQSGTLAYHWLFLSQALILGIQTTVLIKIYSGTYAFKAFRGKVIFIFGLIYFSMSVLRLVLGSIFWENHLFLGATIPSVFHIFLSSFFLLLGLYEVKSTSTVNSTDE